MLQSTNEIVLLFHHKVPQSQPYYFPSMEGTDDRMYVPVPQDQCYHFPCMDGSEDNIYVLARVSTMQMVNKIGSTSHTQPGIVNNISSQSSTVTSKFVEFNINAYPNAPFFFKCCSSNCMTFVCKFRIVWFYFI
ncbi:unnamed protein product [Camellia sinensis]